MDTISKLQALQKIASSRDDQKILVIFHEDLNVGTQTSLLISMQGSIPFYQLNESYIDDFGLCHDTTPLNAHSALEIIQSYSFFVQSFLNAFVDVLVPDEKPAPKIMGHSEYAHLEKMINSQLDRVAEVIEEVKCGDKSTAYLSIIDDRIRVIRTTLDIHRVKEDQA